MSDSEGQIIVGGGPIQISPLPGPDGYRRLGTALQIWGGVVGYPRDARYWYVVSCARRLDAAHRQIERVRDQLDSIGRGEPGPFNDRLDARIAALVDAELAMVALYRALKMTTDLESALRVSLKRPLPKRLSSRLSSLRELRNAYEHVDERARGIMKPGGKPGDPKGLAAMSLSGAELERTRIVRYGRWSLGLDKPATDLCVALRQWIRDAWVEMCDKELQARQPVPP